jgi:hypothetical protein
MKKEKKPFNPNNFFKRHTVEDIAPKFPHLEEIDFKITSLNEELIKLNYEIISKEYSDFLFSSLCDYYMFEIDEIV